MVRRYLDRVEITVEGGLERPAVLVAVAERDLAVGNALRLRRHGYAPVCNERAARAHACYRPAMSRASRTSANGSRPIFCPLDRLCPVRGQLRCLIARH